LFQEGVAVRRIQRTTIAGVVLLAAIAAVVSFRQMPELCLNSERMNTTPDEPGQSGSGPGAGRAG
jgi:hypothetical protein